MNPAEFEWPVANIFDSHLDEIKQDYYANVREYVNDNWVQFEAVINAYNSEEAQTYIFEESEVYGPSARRQGLQHTLLKAPLPFYDAAVAARVVRDVRARIRYATSINISFGFMQSAHMGTTAKYKYPSNNTRLFDEYLTIVNRQVDMQRLQEMLEPEKVFEKLEQDFVKSYRIQVVEIFQIQVQLWHTHQPVGCVVNALEMGWTRNYKHCLITFGKDATTDNLCFFRCLAYHFDDKKRTKYIKRRALELRDRAVAHELLCRGEQIDVACETYKIEDLFRVNLQFYRRDGELYDFCHSNHLYSTTLHILLHQQHCMVITNVFAFFGKHVCVKCNKFYGRRQTLEKHNCRGKKLHQPKIRYQGGIEQPTVTMFDHLDAMGVHIPQELRYNRGFIAFDVESFLKPPEQEAFKQTDMPNIVEEHVPCSIAVAYSENVDECHYLLTDGDSEKLVRELVAKMMCMYRQHMARQTNTYGQYLDEFEQCMQEEEDDADYDMEAEKPYESEQEIAKLCKRVNTYRKSPLDRLKRNLYSFVYKLPVLGFNSSSYDLNVLKEWLFPELLAQAETSGEAKFDSVSVLKRRNRYMSVDTPHFKFIDAYLFVAAGTSLKAFMKSQLPATTMGKLEFPYRYLKNLNVLQDTELPPVEQWLMEERVFNAETNADKRAKMLAAAAERRAVAQAYWDENNLQTFGDYLRAYNVADVKPFVQAFQRFANLFKQKKFDVFNYITLPAIAKDYGVRSSPPGCYFMKFDEKSKSAYEKIRANLYGGLAMVWNRHVECGVTTIRPYEVENAETVQSILGVDMSGCYLYASAEEHMTGSYFERHAHKHFAITDNIRELNAVLAVEYMAYVYGKDAALQALQHKWKGGERRFVTRHATQYRVDGYFELNNKRVVIEYNGCYYHNHDRQQCRYPPRHCNPRCNSEREAKRLNVLKGLCDTIIIVWECEWRGIRDTRAAADFIKTRPMYETYSTQRGLTQSQVLERVMNNKLKGLIEIDAYVPPQEAHRFRDLCPFFYRTKVKWSMIGATMQNIMASQHREFSEREMLLNPPYCEKLLLPHQYIKFLIENRIQILKVHYVLEFPYASRPFEALEKEISERRQEAAVNPELEAEGLRLKYIGNAVYGTFITNPHDFTVTRFVSREKAERELFQRAVVGIEQLNDNVFELTVKKYQTVIRQPVQFGMVVYALSKLRVLRFALEWFSILEYEKYALVLSDTDSIYMCFARHAWEECRRAGVSEAEVEQFKERWFAMTADQSKKAGLWHDEFNGSLVIALAPKLYVAVFRDSGKLKLAARGISAKHNALSVQMFRDALYESNEPPDIVAQSFRVLNCRMVTWRFFPSSFVACYIKRQVLPDLSNTRALKWHCPPWVQIDEEE